MPRAWSTAQPQPPQKQGEKPVTVLVTGFGPFLQQLPNNSSWEIASTLPALLPATKDNPTPVHIHVYHEAVRVAYNQVVNLVPRLLPPANTMSPKPDIILHIGLAAGRTYYTLEEGAHGRGYGAIPDVDGERFMDDLADAKFPHELFPPKLQTGFDTDDALYKWKVNLGYEDPNPSEFIPLNEPDVRISPDAGNFMCGFIYYNSLAHYYDLAGDGRPVAFLHVPDLSESQEELDTGREVTVALIRALVASFKETGAKHKGDRNEEVVEGGSVRAGTDVNFA
ncbi:pyroglutamyl peptidase-like protein type I [Lophiotrema nucula]|uniref:Pyroglutamyl peptidase-like protein type I n=1 Tax=Lophiotrema nucula TaxID=690887 RepID=A0A6A5YIC4_9PLEO|nr:pyroglutamyl peptidase-like protein type I [Lophiotrema nucula]